MQFPFSYTGELVFYKPDEFDVDIFLTQIETEVNINSKDSSEVIFSAPFSFSKLPIKIKMRVRDYNAYIHCKYQISLFENNIIFLLTLTFAAFFLHFDNHAFSFISVVTGLLYYFFNLAKISNSIKALIYKQIGGSTDIGTPELWKQQKQWMKDTTLCPACGESKNEYSNKCINCGLYFDKNKPKINQVNTSISGNNEIVYEVIKKKK